MSLGRRPLAAAVVIFFNFGGSGWWKPGYDESCDRLSSCFLFIFSQGIRNGGGIGDIMLRNGERSGVMSAQRVQSPLEPSLEVLSLAFFLLVNIIRE